MNSWQKFNVLKLLTYSSISRQSEDLSLRFSQYITDEFEKTDDVLIKILYIRYYFEIRSREIEFTDENGEEKLFSAFLSKLDASNLSPVVLATIFWIFRHKKELLDPILQKYYYESSRDVQIMIYYYLKQN